MCCWDKYLPGPFSGSFLQCVYLPRTVTWLTVNCDALNGFCQSWSVLHAELCCLRLPKGDTLMHTVKDRLSLFTADLEISPKGSKISDTFWSVLVCRRNRNQILPQKRSDKLQVAQQVLADDSSPASPRRLPAFKFRLQSLS